MISIINETKQQTNYWPLIVKNDAIFISVTGNILSVTFDTSSALEELWKQYENKALSLLFQSIFVDKSLLNALGVRKLSVRVRMWKDEIDACREEITKLKQEKIDIETRCKYLSATDSGNDFAFTPYNKSFSGNIGWGARQNKKELNYG